MADLNGLSFDDWLDYESRALQEEENNAPAPEAGRPADTASRPAGARHAAPSRRTVQVQPSRPQPKKGGRGSLGLWMKILIPVAVLLTAALAALAVGFTYASRVADITTIYPNVSVNGVAVGGMTVEEAAAVLGDAPDRYENAAVTVRFPTGESVTVTAQELGLRPADGMDFARVAYDYGRGGSMISTLMAYRSCESEPVDIALQRTAQTIDETTIQTLVAPVAQQVNEKLSTTEAQVSDTEIRLVKNTGAHGVDVAALCSQIADAFAREDYTPIDYDVTAQAPQGDGQTGEEAVPVDRDELLQSLYDQVYVEPVSAQYDPVTGSATESTVGVRFDMDEARRLWDETAEGQELVIPLIKEEPEVTQQQMSEQLFADVLAEKSTSLAGSTSARINNITLAAAAMNGTVLQPGQEFNYNACLGERTAAKGYQSAGAFAGGQHVMSIGGGICQGSSTLYYCALKANLNITERWCHQFVVGYLPRGMDATVSWGFPDFKFVNSRSYPIRIEAWVSGGYLTVRILGTDVDGTYVDITNETWEDSTHYYAQTWRNVYDSNGNLLSSNKEAFSSYDKEEALAAAAATPAPTQAPQAPVVEEAPPVYVEPDPVVPETPVEPEVPAEPAPEPEAPPAVE